MRAASYSKESMTVNIKLTSSELDWIEHLMTGTSKPELDSRRKRNKARVDELNRWWINNGCAAAINLATEVYKSEVCDETQEHLAGVREGYKTWPMEYYRNFLNIRHSTPIRRTLYFEMPRQERHRLLTLTPTPTMTLTLTLSLGEGVKDAARSEGHDAVHRSLLPVLQFCEV